MKKLERKVDWKSLKNPIVDVISTMIDNRIDGDYNEYKNSEDIKYSFYLDDFIDEGIKIEDVKEFVGEGFCLEINKSFGIWYNVSIEEDNLIVDWVHYIC